VVVEPHADRGKRDASVAIAGGDAAQFPRIGDSLVCKAVREKDDPVDIFLLEISFDLTESFLHTAAEVCRSARGDFVNEPLDALPVANPLSRQKRLDAVVINGN